MTRAWASMILAAGLLAGCATPSGQPVVPPREVGTAEAMRLVAAGQVVPIDTRSPHEFTGGHIPGAVMVPFGSEGTAKGVREAAGEKQPMLYCRNGRRSGIVLGELGGISNVLHFKGGMTAWKAAGGEVRQGEERPMGEEGRSDVYRFKKPKGGREPLSDVYRFF